MVHIQRRDFVAGLAAAGAGLALSPRTALAQPAGRIDVHHHFAPPYWLRDSSPAEQLREQKLFNQPRGATSDGKK